MKVGVWLEIPKIDSEVNSFVIAVSINYLGLEAYHRVYLSAYFPNAQRRGTLDLIDNLRMNLLPILGSGVQALEAFHLLNIFLQSKYKVV